MVDTHCHLNFQAFEKDISEVIMQAYEVGVTKIIIPGANLESSKKGAEIANCYDGCFAAVGIHPHHAGEYDRDKSAHLSTLTQLAQQKKVVAIGETGLDYYQYKDYPPILDETKKIQRELFLMQIKIAREFDLPLIIHCREAWEDVTRIVNNYSSSEVEKNNQLRGVFHCYSGGKKWLSKILNMGFFLGIDGNVTYDTGLQTVVKEIPLDKLLLETDSPYLTPLPFRGERNEPKNIKLVAEKIAELKNISFKELEEKIEKNTESLFGI